LGLELLDELNNRNLNKIFIKHYFAVSKGLGDSGGKDYNYFRKKFDLETSFTG
jgi:hypothetical protein